MLKVKVFSSQRSSGLESMVNEWLESMTKDGRSFGVVTVQYSCALTSGAMLFSAIVMYKEVQKESADA